MDVRVGLWRKLSTEELMLFNCGVGEDSWKSLGLQGDPSSPSWRRSVLGVHRKDWCWSWNSNTLATSCEELTHWKDLDAGRDWGQEEKGTTRGWDGWMASPTWWAWVWVNSGGSWWIGRPGMLRFMGSHTDPMNRGWTWLSDGTELNCLDCSSLCQNNCMPSFLPSNGTFSERSSLITLHETVLPPSPMLPCLTSIYQLITCLSCLPTLEGKLLEQELRLCSLCSSKCLEQ